MAQSARCAAVSDAHGLVAFGHDRGYADAHVSLIRLDAKGIPAAFAIPLKLPSPAGLVKTPWLKDTFCATLSVVVLYPPMASRSTRYTTPCLPAPTYRWGCAPG